jgi:hypothetical protein
VSEEWSSIAAIISAGVMFLRADWTIHAVMAAVVSSYLLSTWQNQKGVIG